jgi:hypothetical protein
MKRSEMRETFPSRIPDFASLIRATLAGVARLLKANANAAEINRI